MNYLKIILMLNSSKFGETIFSMIPKEKENKVLEILKKYSDGIIIKSELDDVGARVLHN